MQRQEQSPECEDKGRDVWWEEAVERGSCSSAVSDHRYMFSASSRYNTSAFVVSEGEKFISHYVRFPTWVRDLKQSFVRFPAAASASLFEDVYSS